MSWDKTEGGDFGHSSRLENFIRGLNIELAGERDRQAKLQAENAKLRAATTELLEVVEILHPNMNPDEPCVVYEAWEQGKQALAELDKEDGE